MSSVRERTLPQRVVLVVGLGLCLLAGWAWWSAGDAGATHLTSADWFRYEPGT